MCSNSKKFSLSYLEKTFIPLKGVCFCPECLSASAILWSVCCRYWNLQNTKSHWIYALSSPFIACMTWHTVAWNKIHKCHNFLPFSISSSPFLNIQQRQYLEICPFYFSNHCEWRSIVWGKRNRRNKRDWMDFLGNSMEAITLICILNVQAVLNAITIIHIFSAIGIVNTIL